MITELCLLALAPLLDFDRIGLCGNGLLGD